MTKILFTILFLFTSTTFSQVCDCTRSTKQTSIETTREGGNQLITHVAKGVYKDIRGVVKLGDNPMDDVLIEVFDKPEWITNGVTRSPTDQRRLFACITQENGKFCFPRLAKGNYELRVSKGIGWNPTYYFLKVDPKGMTSINESIEIQLTLGT